MCQKPIFTATIKPSRYSKFRPSADALIYANYLLFYMQSNLRTSVKYVIVLDSLLFYALLSLSGVFFKK